MRTVLVLLVVSSALAAREAEACGCFTPPDPTVPLVQAGERILFAVKDGQVTAHIQVQYAGGDAEFGWLLPLPSVPTLELGNDELFARLLSTTQPRYQMTTVFDSSCGFLGSGGGAGGGAATGGGPGGVADAGSAGGPLVLEASVGPYDYAVLRADSKSEMLTWLAANRYFVPVGTDDAVSPYIRPGGYFLALKLRPGKSTGDLQPVVLRYQSDFGVIPITLTSTGASENMGVQVWMLGDGRAIPRNYVHTLINDAAIDWTSSGANYNDVIIRAVGEAPERHTFVTEYAGSGRAVKQALLPPGRFGTQAELAAQPNAEAFIQQLWLRGFPGPTPLNPLNGALALPTTVKSILAAYLPPPPGIDLDTFYANYAALKVNAPPQNYQPALLAAELWSRVVEPTQRAAELFDTHPVLTRLYTTISPADMNRDPAFSFNPSLPEVSNVHRATMTVSCTGPGGARRGALVTEQGWRLDYPNGPFAAPLVPLTQLPASLQIQVLREEGPPQILVDNLVRQASIQTTLTPLPSMFEPTPPREPASGRMCSVTGLEVALLAMASLFARKSRPRRDV